MKRLCLVIFFMFVACALLLSQQAQAPAEAAAAQPAAVEKPSADQSVVIPKGAKVFIAPMPDGFDADLKTAMKKKEVPVTIVDKREDAEFEITGYAETQKAGAAKIIITGSWHSRESASFKVANLKSGVIAYAYSYNTYNSAHGKRSSSEACAKHLKEKIESGK